MIKKILTGVAIAMLVVGIGLVAFPPISNFIGTQISNGEADGFDTRVEEVEDGSFEQAVKDGKVDEEGYKIDMDGKRTSKQPVVFKADLDRLFNEFVTVNGKQVNIPSYLVKAGDVIEIKEKNKNIQRMKDIVEVTGGRLVPDWLEVDAEKLQGTVKELPSREQIDVPVDEMLIVELYSK